MFSEKCEKEVKGLFRKGVLGEDDRRVIGVWIRQVKEHGPDSLKHGAATWNDHPLDRKWSGHRASNFSHSGRIIYRVKNRRVTVVVARVTHDHDYS